MRTISSAPTGRSRTSETPLCCTTRHPASITCTARAANSAAGPPTPSRAGRNSATPIPRPKCPSARRTTGRPRSTNGTARTTWSIRRRARSRAACPRRGCGTLSGWPKRTIPQAPSPMCTTIRCLRRTTASLTQACFLTTTAKSISTMRATAPKTWWTARKPARSTGSSLRPTSAAPSASRCCLPRRRRRGS